MTENTPDTSSGKHRGTENFPVGSLLIRADLRAHVHAFYNFARDADDISDSQSLSPQEKIAQLDNFADGLLHKTDTVPGSVLKMRESLTQTKITPQHCLDLLAAFKRDATKLRYSNWDDLLDYCRYSASPVGRHVLALHNIGDDAWPANDALCSALQIINHIQDCKDDYHTLNRVYIPQDMMDKTGARIENLDDAITIPALRETLTMMLDALAPMLQSARDLPRKTPDIRLKMETSIICVLAERLTTHLRTRDPLCDNVKLDKFSVITAGMWGMARAWF